MSLNNKFDTGLICNPILSNAGPVIASLLMCHQGGGDAMTGRIYDGTRTAL